MDAVSNLREFYTANSCDSIHDQTYGRLGRVPSQEWTTQCEQLKVDLALWPSFELHRTVGCGPPEVLVCLYGSSHLAPGGQQIVVEIILEKGSSRLLLVSFKGTDGGWISTPAVHPWLHLVDPPVPTVEKAG